MKAPPSKSIALIIASKPSADAKEGKEVSLARPNYPSAFLPKEVGVPDLRDDWEGDITFRVKVAHVDEYGIQLDLLSMTAPSGMPIAKKPSPMEDASAAFAKANGEEDDDDPLA